MKKMLNLNLINQKMEFMRDNGLMEKNMDKVK